MASPVFWPFVIYAAAVLVIVAVMIGLSAVLGERHHEPSTDKPYEGGVASTGSARVPVSVKFYLVAMVFVVFDLEAVFLYTWAVAVRELGWAGYVEVLVFVAVLVAALAYLWRLGALDWARRRDVRRAVRQGAERPPVERAA